MLTIASGAGGSSVGLVSYSSGIANEPPQTLLGRPLVEIEHPPVVGDKGDLCLVDPTMYLIGQRLGVVVDASPHARHEYDETCFRVSARFDGSPLRSTTLTLADGVTTVSWAVCIKARG
jgi:HK97 family phage major capsid protein